jgi:hypothetical protein
VGLFSRKPKTTQGHVRLYAERDGRITGVDVLSPLEEREVQPSLEKALQSLEAGGAESREALLEGRLKDIRKKAGMLDRLRGKAGHREEAARQLLPGEVFQGASPGERVLVSIDGNLGFMAVRTKPGVTIEQAVADLPHAVEAAQTAVFERWEQAILADGDEDESEGGAEAAAAEESGG